MLLNEAITGRHSIRSFRPDPVEKSLLLTLADAAQQAPSASNLQAWRFLPDPLICWFIRQRLTEEPPAMLPQALSLCSHMYGLQHIQVLLQGLHR